MKGFLIGIGVGLIFLPATVYGAQKVFDPSVELQKGDGGFSISRFDDPDFKVKCWTARAYYKGGISCLPWDEVKER